MTLNDLIIIIHYSIIVNQRDRLLIHWFRRVSTRCVPGFEGKEPGNQDVISASMALEASIEMLEISNSIHVMREDNDYVKVNVKIGMHTGDVMSGIVGRKKPQFALFGDTVCAASRMKQTGIPNCIHVSNNTFQLIFGQHRSLSRSTAIAGAGRRYNIGWINRSVFVKGMGMTDTWMIALNYRKHCGNKRVVLNIDGVRRTVIVPMDMLRKTEMGSVMYWEHLWKIGIPTHLADQLSDLSKSDDDSDSELLRHDYQRN